MTSCKNIQLRNVPFYQKLAVTFTKCKGWLKPNIYIVWQGVSVCVLHKGRLSEPHALAVWLCKLVRASMEKTSRIQATTALRGNFQAFLCCVLLCLTDGPSLGMCRAFLRRPLKSKNVFPATCPVQWSFPPPTLLSYKVLLLVRSTGFSSGEEIYNCATQKLSFDSWLVFQKCARYEDNAPHDKQSVRRPPGAV